GIARSDFVAPNDSLRSGLQDRVAIVLCEPLWSLSVRLFGYDDLRHGNHVTKASDHARTRQAILSERIFDALLEGRRRYIDRLSRAGDAGIDPVPRVWQHPRLLLCVAHTPVEPEKQTKEDARYVPCLGGRPPVTANTVKLGRQ